jgi:general secretion pathway protein J
MTPPRRGPARDAQAGFTLVEVLVALALFALIGAAGFAVLDQVLRVQARTEGRLDQLADVQRAMHLVTTDFLQATNGSLAFTDGAVSLRRNGGTGEISIQYALADTVLVRNVSADFTQGLAPQVLLTGVAALDWQFYTAEGSWVSTWPPAGARRPENPRAVALDATLAGSALSGHLRRVALLPAEAAP